MTKRGGEGSSFLPREKGRDEFLYPLENVKEDDDY